MSKLRETEDELRVVSDSREEAFRVTNYFLL